MKNINETLLCTVILLTIISGGYFLLKNKSNVNDSAVEQLSEMEKSNIYTLQEQNLYKNETYGFSFNYPQDWHIGIDNLGRGPVQFFNYEETNEREVLFSSGRNKIEAVIVKNNPFKESNDYPEKLHVEIEASIAGRKATRTEIELIGGEKMLGYLVPLPNDENKSLAITIYGDPDNFYILENIIDNFEWLK